jgi:hypothetical protein
MAGAAALMTAPAIDDLHAYLFKGASFHDNAIGRFWPVSNKFMMISP